MAGVKKSYKKPAASAASGGSLSAFRAGLAKEYKDSLIDLADTGELRVISTGIIPLDVATGIGGFPLGRVIEVFGPPSGGKTLTLLIAAGEAQRRTKKAILYIDTEGNTDKGFIEWAQKLGVDTSEDTLVVVQPVTAEDAFDITEKALNTKMFCYIIIDSLAGLVPSVELAKELSKEPPMALRARLLARALRKLVGPLAKSDTALIFINQITTMPGVMFGSDETTPGGKAVKFYAALRMRVSPEFKGEEKTRGQTMGHTVKVKIEKNKCAPPKRIATYDVNYFNGIDRVRTLQRLGVDMGVVTMQGKELIYDGNSLGANRVEVTAALAADPLLRDKIEEEIREKLLRQSRGESLANATEESEEQDPEAEEPNE